jgi:hypothetical protein
MCQLDVSVKPKIRPLRRRKLTHSTLPTRNDRRTEAPRIDGRNSSQLLTKVPAPAAQQVVPGGPTDELGHKLIDAIRGVRPVICDEATDRAQPLQRPIVRGVLLWLASSLRYNMIE